MSAAPARPRSRSSNFPDTRRSAAGPDGHGKQHLVFRLEVASFARGADSVFTGYARRYFVLLRCAGGALGAGGVAAGRAFLSDVLPVAARRAPDRWTLADSLHGSAGHGNEGAPTSCTRCWRCHCTLRSGRSWLHKGYKARRRDLAPPCRTS
eukprot:scaffold63_cov306-Pinguiococcus_pyrenoidosus.AAC.56